MESVPTHAPAAAHEGTVSMVVPVRNEASTITRCLVSLLDQTYPATSVEILVVDGRSTDGTIERIAELQRAHPGRIRLLENPLGSMPTGLNQGILNSCGDFVGVVSGHSVLPVDYIERAISTLGSTRAWAVGGQIRRIATSATQRAIAIATASPFGVGDAKHNFEATAGEVEAVFPGMWPRWVFDIVGLFDVEMLSNEDNEFSYRIRKAGGRIWLDPEIRVDYKPRATYWGLFRQYERYGRGKVRVSAKHPGSIRFRHVIPAMWVGGIAVGTLLAAVVSHARPAMLAALTVYTAVMSYGAKRTTDSPTSAARVLMAFMTLHLSYGVGLWHGIVEQVARRMRGSRR